MDTVKVGDVVKSYDFDLRNHEPGTRKCFVLGVVEEITPDERYKLRTLERVVLGKVIDRDDPLWKDYCYPPVNGTEGTLGTDGVVVIVAAQG